MCQSRPTNWIMKTLLTFILCLIGLSALCQGNALLRNRYTTNADSATVHGDHLDALKADKLATGIADPARLGSGTANAGTALFGDSSWKIISASGNLVAEGTNGITAVTNGQLVTISFNGLNVVLSNASFQGPFTGVGAAAGKVVLNSGSGTGGYYDYSGATASNHLVAMVDGRFVDGGSTNGGGSQVWSNYQGYIFPAGEPAPDVTGTLPGPSFFFGPDGGQYVGTNITQDVNPTAIGGINLVSLTDSNEPNHLAIFSHIIDNTSALGIESLFDADIQNNGGYRDHSYIKTSSYGTNFRSVQTLIGSDPSGFATGGKALDVSTNLTTVFNVDTNGLVTANGFTDNSGTPGSLVAYQGSNRQGATNGVAWQAFNNSFSGSNYFGGDVTTATNTCNGVPDFSKPESLFSTNNAIVFATPIGVDTTKTTVQWILVNTTNTTASAVTITPPANCHLVGTGYCTNLSQCWFQCYAQKWTNLIVVPCY